MVAARRNKGGLVSKLLLQFETENTAIERESTIEIGHLQVDVADIHAWIDWVGGHV
jgi:hypothetical protein